MPKLAMATMSTSLRMPRVSYQPVKSDCAMAANRARKKPLATKAWFASLAWMSSRYDRPAWILKGVAAACRLIQKSTTGSGCTRAMASPYPIRLATLSGMPISMGRRRNSGSKMPPLRRATNLALQSATQPESGETTSVTMNVGMWMKPSCEGVRE